jgi:hypothetical protein
LDLHHDIWAELAAEATFRGKADGFKDPCSRGDLITCILRKGVVWMKLAI